jgi:putative membrane-bound dehydrogenase-like protein
MRQPLSSFAIRFLGLATTLTLLDVGSVRAQRGTINLGLGPQLPKSGSIVRDTAHERSVLEQTTVPAGFKVQVFALPPVAMYPTAIATSPDGSVYVGVDLNLAQGAVKGRGRIMRLVDDDSDGHADRYTTFVEVESPRGIAVDKGTVFVMHPPNLTAYRDTNGDGIADDSVDIVKGLGFGIDVRSSDHSTNNITLSTDGWIYVAVGDYGYVNATGTDGTRITHHGGSVVRVRPDGSGLEIYATGTRNIFDVGIDPFGHVFARDNTNDGGGWNTRFHYLPPNADMGYPSLFANFADEPMQSLSDFGAGAGTGALWIQDPGFPPAWNNQLYTADWTVNKVLFNPVVKRGASYSVTQKDFVTISHALDFAMDDRSHMFVASLIGGVFNYAGDTVGAILRVAYPARAPSHALQPSTRTDAQLVSALASDNSQHRLWAQRELVHRTPNPATVNRLREMALDRTRPAYARATALFTLPLLIGADAQSVLLRAASDPGVREVALRTLADDKRVRDRVSASVFVKALSDPDPAVRVQAINGLDRRGAREHARAIVPLLASSDSTLGHLAYRALASLGARDVALDVVTSLSSAPAARTRARFALQLMQDTVTVNAVMRALGRAQDAISRRELTSALARLYNTEGPWNGDWWGTHPTTAGPYFAPVAWDGSAAIKPVLRAALANANGSELEDVTKVLASNRVMPRGAALLVAKVPAGPTRDAAIDALVGEPQLTERLLPLLAQLDSGSGELHEAVARAIAQESAVPPSFTQLARRAVLDRSLPADVRARVLNAVASTPGAPGRAAELVALMNPTVPELGDGATRAGASATSDPIELTWRRFVGARERNQEIDFFADLAATSDPAQRTLAFAVLAQAARNPRSPQGVRERVHSVFTEAWKNPVAARSLAEAIRIMRLENQYAEQLKSVPNP